MAKLLKLIHRFSVLSMKIAMSFPTELKKAILKFIWDQKRLRTATAILGNKNNAGGITVPELGLHCIKIQQLKWRGAATETDMQISEATKKQKQLQSHTLSDLWQRSQTHALEER